MNRTAMLLIYNTILPLVFLLAFPGWVVKMYRRGGFGTGLLQRLGVFKGNADKQGGVYIHSVSVGETFIALKLIRKWQELFPDEHFVLVPTTATGHAVALEQAPKGVKVIYSPVDFGFILRKVMKRFRPKLVVLIESEMWPNLLNVCSQMSIPVAVANARLSPRSERRYAKLSCLVKPIFAMVSKMLVQEKEDVKRWSAIGVSEEVIENIGSIKFDHTGGEKPTQRQEFSEIINRFSRGRKVVMVMSSFAGEERAIARELKALKEKVFLVLVPRHMERRQEVKSDVLAEGYVPVLRSDLVQEQEGDVCLIIDSTGELRDWTAHADIAVIGKSWVGKGGQNPTEAIAAGVPIIMGPRMDNFEPLASSLANNNAAHKLDQVAGVKEVVLGLLSRNEDLEMQCEMARKMLSAHSGATERAVESLAVHALTM